jgi:hypothetical protein
VALAAQVVKADALLLAVELHYGRNVVAELALVAARAHALCEIEANLRVGAIMRVLPLLLLAAIAVLQAAGLCVLQACCVQAA